MRLDFEEEFRTAVSKALLLLSYSSEKGINLDDKIVKPIIDARNSIESDQPLNPDEEQAFWIAYSDLSSKIDPVSISSLIAVKVVETDDQREINPVLKKLGFGKKPTRSVARKSVVQYRRYFIIAMFMMLFIQIYWVIGLELIKDAEAIPRQINEKLVQIDSLILELGDQSADDSRIMKLEGEAIDLDGKLDIRFNILVNWNTVWQTVTLVKLNSSDSTQLPGMDNGKKMDKRKGFESSLLKAKFTSGAIGRYLLPLMYGLLGAFAFVLRRLSEAIRNLEYTHESNINYTLRLHLGALAGLAIGWFSGPVTDAEILDIGTLSPLALAFLAGYSVELLFTIMDQLILKKGN